MNEFTPKQAQEMKDQFLDNWPELRRYCQDAPAPSPPPDFRPRKSRHGRAPNVRHFDRNDQAKQKVLAAARLGIPLKYSR